MASVLKKKRSPYWYCAFTDATGRRLKKSTGLTARSKALQMCFGWQRAADLARERTLTEERAREILSDIVASVHGGEGLRSFTVRKWFNHFGRIKAKSRSQGTAARYQQLSKEFLAFLGPKCDLNILAITSDDVRKFREHREAIGLSASTLNDDLTILSAIFNGAWRDHVISNNPCTAIEPARDNLTPSKRKKQPFTLEQIKTLLEEAKGDWHSLIKVAYYTGARLGNCANLRFRNLDYSEPAAVVVFENYSKHGDEHKVPMHPVLEDYLLDLKPKTKSGDEFLFPSLASQRVTNLSKQFRKLMEAARIRNWKVRQRGKGAARDVWALGFHSFRRTHVTTLANAGVSEERRMAITAHATREIHKGYTHHELAQLAQAVALLPKV
jgi:integrase